MFTGLVAFAAASLIPKPAIRTGAIVRSTMSLRIGPSNGKWFCQAYGRSRRLDCTSFASGGKGQQPGHSAALCAACHKSGEAFKRRRLYVRYQPIKVTGGGSFTCARRRRNEASNVGHRPGRDV